MRQELSRPDSSSPFCRTLATHRTYPDGLGGTTAAWPDPKRWHEAPKTAVTLPVNEKLETPAPMVYVQNKLYSERREIINKPGRRRAGWLRGMEETGLSVENLNDWVNLNGGR